MSGGQDGFVTCPYTPPKDPHIIYISAPFDPRTGTATSKHEIFEGITLRRRRHVPMDPITWNSTRDNLRPIVSAWALGGTLPPY
jgi:hypothetical protein